MITKTKKSVSISKTLLEELSVINKNMNISKFIEIAIVHYINELKKKERIQRDIQILNENADRFLKEAEENLEFQDEL